MGHGAADEGERRAAVEHLILLQVVRCAISPSSKLAATATQDHSIQIWELPSGRILQDLTVSLLSISEWSIRSHEGPMKA